MTDDRKAEITKPKTGKPRGFAAMSSEKRREIAALGGKAVPPESRSFSKNRELARSAGHTGGLAVKAEDRAYSKDTELARRSGAVGGNSAQAIRRAKK